MKNQSFSKQLPLNLITNISVFLAGIVINLILTPYYIKYLGTEGLGLIRLAVTLPIYTGLISLIISGSVGRFLTIDLHKETLNEAKQTFNTAFFGITGILMILIPVIFILVNNLEVFFDIPDKFKVQSYDLFLFILLSSVLTLFSGLFMIPAYAKNRLDITNIAKLITTLLQFIFIIVILQYLNNKISYVGYAYFIAAFIGVIISILVWKRFNPELIINYKMFNLSKLKEMMSTSYWLMINQLGTIFFLYIDLVLINIYYGSAQVGEYSVALQWNTLLRTLASVVAGVLGPMIIISYAKKHMDKIIKISNISVKILGLTIAIPIGIISGLAAPFLTLWLDESFAKLAPLMWLMLLPLSINLSILPLFSVQAALNKIKIPGIVSFIIGFINLLLAIIFIKIFDIGIYSVALASAIILTFKNFIFTPIYVAKILNLNKKYFYEYTIPGLLLSLVIFAISIGIQQLIVIQTWFALITIGIIISLLSLMFIWFIILSKEDKGIIHNIISKKREKK